MGVFGGHICFCLHWGMVIAIAPGDRDALVTTKKVFEKPPYFWDGRSIWNDLPGFEA
ncbi:MAG: hypothetical protein AB4426_27890 [Xenococcaceae cyanobacterium]